MEEWVRGLRCATSARFALPTLFQFLLPGLLSSRRLAHIPLTVCLSISGALERSPLTLLLTSQVPRVLLVFFEMPLLTQRPLIRVAVPDRCLPAYAPCLGRDPSLFPRNIAVPSFRSDLHKNSADRRLFV